MPESFFSVIIIVCLVILKLGFPGMASKLRSWIGLLASKLRGPRAKVSPHEPTPATQNMVDTARSDSKAERKLEVKEAPSIEIESPLKRKPPSVFKDEMPLSQMEPSPYGKEMHSLERETHLSLPKFKTPPASTGTPFTPFSHANQPSRSPLHQRLQLIRGVGDIGLDEQRASLPDGLRVPKSTFGILLQDKTSTSNGEANATSLKSEPFASTPLGPVSKSDQPEKAKGRLAGRSCLVTGATSGIGAGFLLTLFDIAS
jgi:hypothetical protein